ncbi:MAG TPA: FmdB family zinc ribbon protein [Acidimicrobiales bacterium]|nr:FmdB family zinc ribbon protein [Acidimicrobiales bacterium]
MPTYEYRCKGCGRELEVVQSFDEPSLTVCPHCSGPLRKVFGSIGITFKGDGFYKTDNRSNGKKSASSTASTGSSGSGDGSSSAGDHGHSHSHDHSHGGHSHSHGDHSHSSSSSSSSTSSSSSSSSGSSD